MKRVLWIGLVGLITLLQSGLWGLGMVQAHSDKYALVIPAKTSIKITSEQLGAVAPGGKLTGFTSFDVQVSVPGQGNSGNKYILSWQLEPASGSDFHLPGGEVYCKIGGFANSVEGIGDRNFASQLFWEIPGSTPPGEYRYRVTLKVGMGAQGQGVQCTETMEVIIKIPGFTRLWTEPGRVDLTYLGPDNIGSKEDLVYVYVSCNVPWKLRYKNNDRNRTVPVEAIIEGVSPEVSGSVNQWAPILTEFIDLAVGSPTGKSWVLLRLRSDPRCSLKTGTYPFELGFELEAR